MCCLYYQLVKFERSVEEFQARSIEEREGWQKPYARDPSYEDVLKNYNLLITFLDRYKTKT